ncbi:MAG: S-layer homology domain-containing protein [Eubacteriales bacterium]
MKHFPNWWSKGILVAILTVALAVSTAAFDFSDVNESDWFYPELSLMVEQGVVSGYPDGTFLPYNTVSMGEVSKMLYVFETGDTLDNGTAHWASNYADALCDMGWFASNPVDLDAGATRLTVVETVLTAMGGTADESLANPFVDVNSAAANTLYSMGIINGSVENGDTYLKGDDVITRAEFCAILDRTYYYMNPDEVVEEVEETVVEEVVAPTAKYPVTDDYTTLLPVADPIGDAVITYDYFYNLFVYMIAEQETVYTVNLSYTAASRDQATEVDTFTIDGTKITSDEISAIAFSAFCDVKNQHHDMGSFYETLNQSYSYGEKNLAWTMTIYDVGYSAASTISYQNAFYAKLVAAAQAIYDSGAITDHMSQYEIAEYLYKYMGANYAYDTNYNDISYNGYGLMTNGVGVCQAYTATYNGLCKLFGIEIYGVTGTTDGEGHIWSYANLDGTWLYIDVTYGDPVPDRDTALMDFFALTKAEISKTHIFD